MAHTNAYVTDQPVIAADAWPFRIEFDDGAVWITVTGDKPELAAWCREFAVALTERADYIEAEHREDRRVLAAANAELERLRATHPAPTSTTQGAARVAPDAAAGEGGSDGNR